MKYPSSWYRVFARDDVSVGDVLPLTLCGQQLVFFYPVSGEPAVLDAHCPHLGAHLGYGGEVDVDGIRCGFHHWKFGTDGACLDVPYREGAAPNVALRRWPMHIDGDSIYVYHDSAGIAPSWKPHGPDILRDCEWSAPRDFQFEFEGDCRDVVENLADNVHFHFVHGTPKIPEIAVHIDRHALLVEMWARTESGDEDWRNFFHVEGLGLIWLHMPEFGVVVLTTVTPIEDRRIRFGLRLRRRLDECSIDERRFEQLANDLACSTARDLPIWEHRRYPARPVILPEDGPLHIVRRWTAQYYRSDGDVGH